MRNYKEKERNGERGREKIRDIENRERKCVCVCVRERERVRETKSERVREREAERCSRGRELRAFFIDYLLTICLWNRLSRIV